MRVRVVVPSWNVREELRDCLLSLSRVERPELDVVVVDDASQDGSAELVAREFPRFRLMRLKENQGFAGACNRGLDDLDEPYALLLNADTRVAPDSIARLVDCLEGSAGHAAAAPRLVNEDGSTQRACMGFPRLATALWFATPLERWFPESRELRRYFLRDFDHESERDVDQPPAACLLLRTSALRALGGAAPLDEDLRVFFNDVDLSRRLAGAGWRTRFVPGARVVHLHGRSTRQMPDRLLRWHLDRLTYYRKHHGRLSGLLLKSLAVWSLVDFALRQATSGLRGALREPVAPAARSLGRFLVA